MKDDIIKKRLNKLNTFDIQVNTFRGEPSNGWSVHDQSPSPCFTAKQGHLGRFTNMSTLPVGSQ